MLKVNPLPAALQPAARPYLVWLGRWDGWLLVGLWVVVQVCLVVQDHDIKTATATSSNGTTSTISGSDFRFTAVWTGGNYPKAPWIKKLTASSTAAASRSISARSYCSATISAGRSIQDAVNKQPQGAVICLGSGRFNTGNVVLKARQTLVGAGSTATHLDGSVSVKTTKSGKLYKIKSTWIPTSDSGSATCKSG
ncbi:hypothetical protein, partial [Thermocatellispora tengchongensis]|uniref:hypothetical protein n=1 Tax=Thermocatellispora tengchongensis TaxID=1073253 RepID=UPI0031E90702